MNTLFDFLMSSKNAVITEVIWSPSHFLVRFKILPDGRSWHWLGSLKQRLRAPDVLGSAILYETDIDCVLISSVNPGLLAQQLKAATHPDGR